MKNIFLVFSLIICSTIYSGHLTDNQYKQLAEVLIDNQINKDTILQLINEINMVQNLEIIELDGDRFVFQLSDVISNLIKSINLFIFQRYKNLKTKSVKAEIFQDWEDKSLTLLKAEIAKELGETIIKVMESK